MTDCICLSRCPFFNDKMAKMPTIASFYKKQLCKNDFSKCARFMVVSANLKPPADLYPDQVEAAKAYIRDHSSSP